MKHGKHFLWAAAILAMCTLSARADQLTLLGTLRDFQEAHADFEPVLSAKLAAIQGIVLAELGPDGDPVLSVDSSVTNADDPLDQAIITVTFGNTLIHAESTKDLSNVVLELSDGTEYKYDNLDTQGVTTSHFFAVPEEHAGTRIVGAWVKSGNNDNGDGSGYGEYFAEPVWLVDPSWNVDSPVTFNHQWFDNVAGVNRSVPLVLTLDNGQSAPGGVYRYEALDFFPIDGQLFGDEGAAHNYHFTYETHATFTYSDPATRSTNLSFSVSSDDDVWVFIDGALVIDLGGVHGEQFGTVDIDAIAPLLGLEPGENYTIDLFIAERHSGTGSALTIETNLPLSPAQYD